MRLRLTKIDELQFLTCLKHQLWGSRSARFKDWRVGDHLAFIVGKTLAGLAEVAGEPFVSRQAVWDNGVFPHRVPIRYLHVVAPDQRPPILGDVRNALTSAWGANYGWGIINQQLLMDETADKIINAIQSTPNALPAIEEDLESQIEQARVQRDLSRRVVRRARRTPTRATPAPIAEERTPTPGEESAHSRAQHALIRLGMATGCAIWIASNDRGRLYRGKNLGDGCLKTLPKMGLSDEAVTRISLIDVIWIRQNAPVCAFEVETTTSIYSGLLRLADLLAVVPALKLSLFIVAPKERQGKVMGELSRPTFKKIGLSEYCRFVATEELETLLQRVGDLTGHVQPTIVESIAIEAVEEFAGSLE